VEAIIEIHDKAIGDEILRKVLFKIFKPFFTIKPQGREQAWC